MAVRKRLYHPDEVREKIKASQLINRLISCSMGEVELTPVQLGAIKILIDKVLPNLATVEISGDISHHFAIEIPAPAESVEAWSKQQLLLQ